MLSPAKSWKSFGTLDIAVNTLYYMTESGPEGFERTDDGYACHLTGLPKGELTFTLCSEPEPKAPVIHNNLLLLPIIVLCGAVLVILIILLRKIKARR